MKINNRYSTVLHKTPYQAKEGVDVIGIHISE